MAYARQILALDLAQRSGWALGSVNDTVPTSGSLRWAKEGSSMAKVFNECRVQMIDFLAMNPDIGIVIFEAPLIPSFKGGNTNINTIRTLMGLCAVVEELLYAYGDGRYDVREARVSDVRNHFLGSNRHKRPVAKALTLQRCRELGWKPQDDNAADALALWHYQASLIEPKLAIQTSPLFQRLQRA